MPSQSDRLDGYERSRRLPIVMKTLAITHIVTTVYFVRSMHPQ
jgi:hypothetical protein